ncbi:MAG: PilZ domain-containing protein [Pseudomonadota bacterium]|nr:PilZ domain-containing protein [Pseudomonadota bacterium]
MVKSADQSGRGGDIVAHLYYAVGSANEVIITSSAGDFPGKLCYPEGDGVVLACDSAALEISLGEPICVEYMGPADTYRFYSEVLSVTPGRIVSAFPFAVECTTGRRLAERLVVPVLEGYALRLGDGSRLAICSVVDLSVGGLAFIDAGDMGLKAGDLESGMLLLPGEAPIPMGVEVRHLGLRRGQLVVGARIAAISLRDRLHLSTYLVELGKRCAATAAAGPVGDAAVGVGPTPPSFPSKR